MPLQEVLAKLYGQPGMLSQLLAAVAAPSPAPAPPAAAAAEAEPAADEAAVEGVHADGGAPTPPLGEPRPSSAEAAAAAAAAAAAPAQQQQKGGALAAIDALAAQAKEQAAAAEAAARAGRSFPWQKRASAYTTAQLKVCVSCFLCVKQPELAICSGTPLPPSRVLKPFQPRAPPPTSHPPLTPCLPPAVTAPSLSPPRRSWRGPW